MEDPIASALLGGILNINVIIFLNLFLAELFLSFAVLAALTLNIAGRASNFDSTASAASIIIKWTVRVLVTRFLSVLASRFALFLRNS